MTNKEETGQKGELRDITSPDADHPGEATSPPGNGDRDDQAVEQGLDRLDQAGGGH